MSKTYTACFSGYRPDKFPFELNAGRPEYFLLQDAIRRAVEQAVEDGFRRFLCGMAEGFDLLGAEAVLDIRRCGLVKAGEVELVAVLPFGGHQAGGRWRADSNLSRWITDGSSQIKTP